MEAYVPLGIYGVRASQFHKFVLQSVTSENRSAVVYRGIGLHGVPIIFRADGIVLFDFPKIEQYAGGSAPSYTLPQSGVVPDHIQIFYKNREIIRGHRYLYINAFLTCLYSSIESGSHLAPPVNPNRYILADKFDESALLTDNGSCDIKPLPFFDPISITQIEKAVTLLRSVNQKDEQELLESLEFYYRASYHKDNHEGSTALIIFWAIIERAQNRLWRHYVNGGYKAVAPYANVSGQRKKVLLNDRNYTASIKTQILALGNVLFDQEVEWLDRTRKRRNDFMHSLTPVDGMDVAIAQLAAARLIKKNFGIELNLFGGTASWDNIR